MGIAAILINGLWPSVKIDNPLSTEGFFFVRRFRNFIADRNLEEKYSVSLKTLLQQGISEPEFYENFVNRCRKVVGKSNFSEQFRKLINRYKRIGYSLDIMRQTVYA